MSHPATEHEPSQLPKPDPKQELKREVIEFVKMVTWFLVLFLLLRTYVIEGYEVQGISMEPTLYDHDRILVFKLPHLLSQFSLLREIQPVHEKDVVVFQNPSDSDRRYVKRVVATGPERRPGKTVEAGERTPGESSGKTVMVQMEGGKVFVNHRRLSEEYLPPEATASSPSSPRTETILDPGTYFVLGDNRGISHDSRSFGPVKDDQIVGTAVLRFWPLTRFGLVR